MKQSKKEARLEARIKHWEKIREQLNRDGRSTVPTTGYRKPGSLNK